MFNPLTPSQVTIAIGLAARGAARADGELGEFERGQLKSAYSASRHLAIEIANFDSERRLCAAEIAQAVGRAASSLDPSHGEALRACGDEVHGSRDAAALGAAVADLLERCRGRSEPAWKALRSEIHRSLRTLCDREVALLSDGLEAGRG